MSRWFRFHAEALDDPKVQKLDGDTFKAWINLLCLASRNSGFLPSNEDIAFALRMGQDAALAVVERLLNATLIDKVSGGVDGYRYAPHGWEERQYKSDTSTDRVKRFRERSKPVTETPPDTETEAEEKTPPNPRKRGNSERSLIPPDWKAPLVCDLPPKARAMAEQWTPESYDTEAEAYVCYWRSERKMKGDWNGTWANRIIQRHSAIMRDQKFGNAAPVAIKPVSPEQHREQALSLAKLYDRMGRTEEAEDIRRKHAMPIGQLSQAIAARAGA